MIIDQHIKVNLHTGDTVYNINEIRFEVLSIINYYLQNIHTYEILGT